MRGSVRVTRTAVDISNHHLGTFIGEKSRCFGADSLACAGDDGYLASEHARRVVEVLVDLIETVGGGHDSGVICFLFCVPFCAAYSSLVKFVFVQREGKQEGWGLIQSARLNSALARSAEARRGPKVWG